MRARDSRRELWIRVPLLLAGCCVLGSAFLARLFLGRVLGLGLIRVLLGLAGAALISIGARASTRLVARFDLGILVGGIMFLLVDAVMRLLCPLPGPGNAEWAGNPGSELTLVSDPDQFQSIHRYNPIGFRGPPVSLIRKTRQRVVCIGDSWTEGIGADEDQTWPAVLQAQLNKGDCDVVNLGDSGAEPDRYLEILAKVGIPLQPTHVIVCIIPSDLLGGPDIPPDLVVRTEFDDPFRERGNWLRNMVVATFPGWTYLIDRTQGRWGARVGAFWPEWDYAHEISMTREVAFRSRVTMFRARQLVAERRQFVSLACLRAAREGRFNGARIISEVARPHAAFACRVSDMGVAEDDLRAATLAWIRWYADTCRNHQAIPILLFFPEAGLVGNSPVGPVEDEFFIDVRSVVKDHSLRDLLESTCEECNVQFLDCTPELQAYRGTERLYLRYDGHPTAAAYLLAGKYVAQSISISKVNSGTSATRDRSP